MSSKAKKLEQTIIDPTKVLSTTLIGSIITTVGILNKKTKEDMFVLWNTFKNNKKQLPNTIIDLTEYVWSFFGTEEAKPLKANIVLLTDVMEIRTPMVTLYVNGNVLPLSDKGIPFGIIGDAIEGKENVNIEFLYDEDGEMYEEDDVD